MKIISIGLYNPLPIKSGVDSYISSLLNPLGKNHDVLHYYFFQSESEKGHYPNEINFQTKYLETENLKKLQGMPKLIQLLRPELIIERSSLKKIKADIIICDTLTYHAGRYISKRNKSPLILIKHNIEWQYLKDNGSRAYLFLKIYENHILRKADAIVTISMNDYKYISDYVDENRIYYLPSNVNTSIFNPDGPLYDFGDDRFNLLFYGSLDRPMNIKALKFIKNSLVPLLEKKHLLKKIRINVFGSGLPPKSLHIEQDKNINYLGTVDDPGKFIRGADLIIVPVRNSGGMKIRLLETLFCGKPVIVTPEAAEGLPNKFKKFVYVEKDANGFLRAIKRFLENTQRVDKIDTSIIEDYVSNSITLANTIDHLLGNKKSIEVKKEG
jgi:glycosyltransferase involved in cell wall biosynthesis